MAVLQQMLLFGEAGDAAPSALGGTWGTPPAGWTLSNGDLTASGVSSVDGVKSQNFVDAGEYISWEITADSAGSSGAIGVGNASATLYPGAAGGNSIGYLTNGSIVLNTNNIGSGASYTSGDVIKIVVDRRTTDTLYIYKNGALQFTDTTYASTYRYAMVGAYSADSNSFTANFS